MSTSTEEVLRVENVQISFLRKHGITEAFLSINIVAKFLSLTRFSSRLLRRKTVIQNANLTVRKGEVFGIFGVNGGGKSTLLNAMAGLVTPDRGEILLEGEELSLERLRSQRSISKFNAKELYGKFTPLEFVSFVSRLYGLQVAGAKATAVSLFDSLGLSADDYSGELIERLSYGSKGKVALVCSLLPLLSKAQNDRLSAPVLILDEPTNGFDVGRCDQLLQIT